MREKTSNISSKFILVFIVIFSMFCLSTFGQKNEALIGNWALQKVSYKKTNAIASNDKESFFKLFNAALVETLAKNQKNNEYELEMINSNALHLTNVFYQSSIEFNTSRGLYNVSCKNLSGEYLVDNKNLFLEWEDAEENNFKILKIDPNQLVIRDNLLKVIFYYKPISKMEFAKKKAILEKEKELECTIPDVDKIDAIKKAEEKYKSEKKKN